jgi:hypothetical protein
MASVDGNQKIAFVMHFWPLSEQAERLKNGPVR